LYFFVYRFKDFASEVRGNMDVEVLLGRQHARETGIVQATETGTETGNRDRLSTGNRGRRITGNRDR
jgi:hypothetical protein